MSAIHKAAAAIGRVIRWFLRQDAAARYVAPPEFYDMPCGDGRIWRQWRVGHGQIIDRATGEVVADTRDLKKITAVYRESAST